MYQGNRTADYEKAKESTITGIKTCIHSWCNKHGVITSSFSKGKQVVIRAIDESISHLSTKPTKENSKNALKTKT